MSAGASSKRLEGATAMASILPAQHSAAKVAGFVYLMTTISAAFAEFYARGSLIVPGNAAQSARNIAASERLFRIGVVSGLVTFAAVVVLVWTLYVILKPINRNLASLAAIWRLGECFILAVIGIFDFAALWLLNGSDLRAFDPQQLQTLAYTFVRMQAGGYRIGLIFYALGSGLFAYLWFRSRYVPRPLAVLGIFSALMVGIVTVATLVFPGVASVVTTAYYGPPGFIFEVGMGLWLLVKGIRVPVAGRRGGTLPC